MAEIKDIPIKHIRAFLDRKSPKESFNDLVDSISKHGVIVPVTVVPLPSKKRKGKSKHMRWELVKGHRRLRAAREVGIDNVPAFVVPKDDADRVKAFFIENEARSSLSAYEIAVLMNADRGHLSLAEIAEKYSMSRNTVRRYTSIIENASEVLTHHLKTGRISVRQAEAITRLSQTEQERVLKVVMAKNMIGNSVNSYVSSLRRAAGGKKISKKLISAQTNAAAKMLAEVEEQYKEAYKRYRNSVEPLIRLIENDEFLQKIKDIDVSHFRTAK